VTAAAIMPFFVQLWANTCQTDDLWPLRSPRMSVMRVKVLRICIPSSKFVLRRPSHSMKIRLIFRLSINRPGDLDLWPFDL